MASSGTIKSWVLNTGTLNGNSCAGAYYSFEWTSSKKSAGVTTVSWNLYGRGRTSSPTKLENEIYLDVVKNGATTRLYTLSDSNGTEQTSFKNYLRASGSFDVTHSNGAGSFTINMKVDIYTGSYHSTSETATLDTNYHNYTVSYNANGGSGAPSAQTKVHGTNLTLSSTKPTIGDTVTYPTGTITISYNLNGASGTAPSAGTGTYTNTKSQPRTFNVWNTNSSGTGTSYSAGGTYSSNASVTLYAQYKNNGSATETRKTNPSIKTASAVTRSNGSVTGYTVSFSSNGSNATAPTAITSTKTRKYTFGGWNTNTSGTGTNYSAATSYTFSASDTLYAKWTSSDTNNAITLPAAITRPNGSNVTGYTVTFNSNGSTATAPSAITSTRTPKYAFAGWNTKSDGSGTNYSAGGSYTPSAATTLHAKWTTSYQNNAITLPAAITRSNGSVTGYKVTFNVPSTVTSPDPITSTKTRKYTFGGWNTNTSGTGTNYSAGGSYTPSAAATLYAKWTSSDTNNAITLPAAPTRPNTAATAYTVTYDANGGSCSTESASAARTTSYTFAGWNTNSSGTGTNYSAGSSYTPSSATTLYSTWNSSTTTAAVTLPTPRRTGYTFRGWQVDVTAKINSLYIDHEDNQTLVVDSVIPDFYIYDDEVRDDYKPEDKFVFYDYQINAAGITVPVIFKTVVSDEYDDPYLPDDAEPFFWVGRVTYNGSEYDCWEKIDDELGGGHVYAYTNVIVDAETAGGIFAAGTTYTPTGDVTLRATWEKLQYTITYDGNGGTASTVPANQQKTHGVDLTLSQEIPEKPNSTREVTIWLDSNGGYSPTSGFTFPATYQHDFLHWSTTDDLVDAQFYFPGESYEDDAPVTLYAVWDCEYHSGSAITLPTPTRAGYSFKGWKEHDGTAIYWNYIADSGRLVRGSVTPICYTATDDDGALFDYENDDDEFIGFSYGVNDIGSTVPIIYKSRIPSVPDYDNGFYYVGKVTVDGVVYDRWRKISFDDDKYSWDSTRSIYVDTNVIVNDNQLITGSVLPRYDTTLTATWEENRLIVSLYKDGSAWYGSGKKISLLQDGHVIEERYPGSSNHQVGFSGFDSGTYTVRVEGFDSEIDYRTVTISGVDILFVLFYTVECNSGIGIASTSGSGIYLENEVASISATVQAGYTWNTWSDSNTDCSRTISVTRKQTLTATATANTYTIKYQSIHGTGSTASSSHTYDSSKALTSNGFSRTGYTFLGWSRSATATTATYTDGQSVKNLSSTNGATVTLYAVWQLSATWDPKLVIYGTTTDVSSIDFGTKMSLSLNVSPSGTFPQYRIVTKIGTTTISTSYDTDESYDNIVIEESSLSEVSSMSSSYSCSVRVDAIDDVSKTVLSKTFTFTQTLTSAAKPTLTITTELVDLTGICPGKELGRYTKVLVKPVVDLKYGAGLTNITIKDPKGTTVVNSGDLADYTTVALDLDNFSGYYTASDPQLTWTVSVSDQRGQTDTETVTIPVTHHIPADVYAYVPYIWSGSTWVKYTPEIASSSSISSSDIYVPFIKG